MLRTSSYVIYVDLPGNPDEMLLVQTYTGAFDRVSRRVNSNKANSIAPRQDCDGEDDGL